MKEYLLLTGASSGIGRQCAIQLSKDYNLILCARREENLIETKNLCNNSDNHLIFKCDLSDISTIDEKLNNFLIQNDIVVSRFLHCAGCLTLLPAKGFDYELCIKTFNTNVFSAMAIMKVLLKKNNKKALKNVVLISALYSKKGVVGNSVYASSKGALDSFMRCMAKELAPNVRVNSILPGGVETEITMTTPLEQKEIMMKDYPLGFGQTEDVANMAEFLFSDKSKWITGQQFSVDGGASA